MVLMAMLPHSHKYHNVLNALIIDTKIGVIIKKVHLLEHIKIVHSVHVFKPIAYSRHKPPQPNSLLFEQIITNAIHRAESIFRS
jgi:hypothetical protein